MDILNIALFVIDAIILGFKYFLNSVHYFDVDLSRFDSDEIEYQNLILELYELETEIHNDVIIISNNLMLNHETFLDSIGVFDTLHNSLLVYERVFNEQYQGLPFSEILKILTIDVHSFNRFNNLKHDLYDSLEKETIEMASVLGFDVETNEIDA